MARTTLTTRVAALEAGQAEILAILRTMQAPATKPKAAPKAAPRPKVAAKVVTTAPAKGAQTRETLSRKDWNRTLTAKARLAGKAGTGCSVYSVVVANWDAAKAAQAAGVTPDAFLATVLASC